MRLKNRNINPDGTPALKFEASKEPGEIVDVFQTTVPKIGPVDGINPPIVKKSRKKKEK